jgi:ADP-ribosyl-[dinitrogen reductase] hydrolase
MNLSKRFRGCLLGLAVGDAVGTAVEFHPRGTFEPLTDMLGGGPFNLQPGQWTDDTSMALCLGTSLVEQGGFDPRDQMERYCRWADEGYLSSTGTCFDIGVTTISALDRFRHTGESYAGSTNPRRAGNGCIMRLAPIPMFFYPDIEKAERYAAESSRTTHGATECIDASRLFARIICRALDGRPKNEVILGDRKSFVGADRIEEIANGEYRRKAREEIRGSGYVVESLEAAMWCFGKTESFEQAILTAANLGDDADTTAAVCGQIAGAFYGESQIPPHWLERLAMRSEIDRLADKLYEKQTTMNGKRPFWEIGYGDAAADTFGVPSKELVDLADKLAPETVILDAGCGDGRNALLFAERDFRVRAFDVSETGVEKLRTHASQRGLEIDAWVQDVRDFEFDRTYGLIICHGVLHFLERGDCDRFLEELRRHTVSGGYNVHTVFTDRLPTPRDLKPFVRRHFKEGEIRDIYSNWLIERFESYVKEDHHPGGAQHRHSINKLVARKPCDG